MRDFFKNRILRAGLLSFFVLAVFLMPVSVAFDTTPTGVVSSSLKIEAHIASAFIFGLGSITADAINTVFNGLGYVFLELCALFTRTGGLLMETALDYTVFEMGARVHEKSILGGTVGNLWSLIRDICNLAFIFGFIYIGIRTIIDPDSATMKRFLSRIIIGALLINFSLFFAKAIIDFSNFTAYQTYTSMTVGDGSISETIMSKLRVTTFYDKDSKGDLILKTTKSNSLSYFIMAGLFLLITAFVFFAGALLLIVRFVSLVLIMVASPLLFAATVFPQTEGMASDLWKKLFSYSFFAPLYILLILISIKIVDGIGLAGSFGTDFTSSSIDNNLSAILNFTIVIFFMISALMIASKMGIAGGTMVVSWGNSLRRHAAHKVGDVSLRYASQKARQFEMAKDDPSKETTRMGRLGASGFGKFVKKTPLLGALQAAGNKATADVAKRTGELKGLRNAQLQARLNTFITSGDKTKWMNDLDRLAIYNVFKDKGDLDELDPEQIRDYIGLLKKNKMGTLPIDKQRMDAYSIADIEQQVMKMKNASDITALHKITVKETKKGDGGYESEAGKRKEHIDAFLEALINQSNGSMIEGLARRKDEITDAFMTRLLEEAGASETKSAEDVAKHFDKLAEAAGAKDANGNEKDPDRKKRNASAAAYFRTSPAARALGLKEAPSTQKKDAGAVDEDTEQEVDDAGQIK